MKRVLIVGVAVLGAVAQAAAADLPQPALPPAQAPVAYIPVAPVYNWGGIYYGINGGYGFGKTDWTNPLIAPGSTGNFNVSGYVVGATVGANYQMDALVLGVEGDLDFDDIQGTNNSAFCTLTCETKNTWLGTARGRIGYAVDRVLFYGTGGAAFGNIQSGVSGNLETQTKVGWTAGSGVEAAFADHWTARAEYLFVDLQNGTCSSVGTCGAPAGDTVKFSTSLVRLGIDYKFR
jgi:outer membrane immunogenic protein